ncbi:MAG: hypothetical protein ACT4P5_03615, partial [Armatimonadota bacterium]
ADGHAAHSSTGHEQLVKSKGDDDAMRTMGRNRLSAVGQLKVSCRNEKGTALLSVLLLLMLIAVVTGTVMAIMQADLTAGIRQQQAVQVFNVAEAGIHYGIARLQGAGAATYTGETTSIADASTTLGQVVIAVRCLDGTNPASSACASSSPAFRHIQSTGTLVVTGPQRVLTAIVEGTTSSTAFRAICGDQGVNFDQGVSVYGDVGSNGDITIARGGTPSKICDSLAGGACAAPSPPPSLAYSGSAFAVGTITCGGGACNSSQIEGTIAPNQPSGSVCPRVTLSPPSSPGTTPLDVAAGTTATVIPATNYGAVTLASSGTSTCPALVSSRATLIIDSGSDPTATVTVQMRSLWVGKCARFVITGVGKVVLWLLEPWANPESSARQALMAEQLSIFGSASTGATPVAISGDRFTINVMSNKPVADLGDCLNPANTTCAAVHFNQSGLISGTFVVPSVCPSLSPPSPCGGFELDQAQITNGAILAGRIQFDRDTAFMWDPASSIGGTGYGNFDRLRYWKDQ